MAVGCYLDDIGWTVKDGDILTNDIYGLWDLTITRRDLELMLKALEEVNDATLHKNQKPV